MPKSWAKVAKAGEATSPHLVAAEARPPHTPQRLSHGAFVPFAKTRCQGMRALPTLSVKKERRQTGIITPRTCGY